MQLKQHLEVNVKSQIYPVNMKGVKQIRLSEESTGEKKKKEMLAGWVARGHTERSC